MISDCKAEQDIPHTLTCRVLGVSESWFYKWCHQPVTAREVRRGKLADAIRQIFEESGGTYGSPKVWVTLVRQGWRVLVNTVARLMAELGLAGRKIRRCRGLPRPGRRPAFVDFVRRDFTADAPDQVWAGDMTKIVIGEGKLYLATVIDLFSRRLLGYAMGARHDAELVVASLNMAAATRGDVRGVIFHSDRGSEYQSRRFRRACRRLGVTQSMGRVGSCFDCEDGTTAAAGARPRGRVRDRRGHRCRGPGRGRRHPERIRSQAAFAKLAGVCPVPASSGKTDRHRLNRGGHRQLNSALYRVVIVRMRFHQPTIDYVARRTTEGKTKKEIIRCLKRYLAREIYQMIKANPHPTPGT
ncbi:IS3 family transposase [Streptomyces sp. NPDC057743]|uniref:IS3 family transposase n=1 Tax=Streptomyces sp. NPDC057743 TaxID=3346236 RepID=UPI00367D517C